MNKMNDVIFSYMIKGFVTNCNTLKIGHFIKTDGKCANIRRSGISATVRVKVMQPLPLLKLFHEVFSRLD